MPYKLYVGNYPCSFTKKDIENLFKDFDDVVVERLFTKDTKSFSFIICNDMDQVVAIIQRMNGTLVSGRELRVRASDEKLQQYVDLFLQEVNADKESPLHTPSIVPVQVMRRKCYQKYEEDRSIKSETNYRSSNNYCPQKHEKFKEEATQSPQIVYQQRHGKDNEDSSKNYLNSSSKSSHYKFPHKYENNVVNTESHDVSSEKKCFSSSKSSVNSYYSKNETANNTHKSSPSPTQSHYQSRYGKSTNEWNEKSDYFSRPFHNNYKKKYDNNTESYDESEKNAFTSSKASQNSYYSKNETTSGARKNSQSPSQSHYQSGYGKNYREWNEKGDNFSGPLHNNYKKKYENNAESYDDLSERKSISSKSSQTSYYSKNETTSDRCKNSQSPSQSHQSTYGKSSNEWDEKGDYFSRPLHNNYRKKYEANCEQYESSNNQFEKQSRPLYRNYRKKYDEQHEDYGEQYADYGEQYGNYDEQYGNYGEQYGYYSDQFKKNVRPMQYREYQTHGKHQEDSYNSSNSSHYGYADEYSYDSGSQRNFARPLHEDIDESLLAWVSVTNFCIGTSIEDIYELFSDYDPIEVRIICNSPRKNKTLTEAHICFKSKDIADDVILNFDNTMFNKRLILVNDIEDLSILDELVEVVPS